MVAWVIAAVAGCLGLFFAWIYWRTVQTADRKVQTADRQVQQAYDQVKETRDKLEQAQVDLQNSRKNEKKAGQELQRLQANPPLPSDARLLSILSELADRIYDRVTQLDTARVVSVEPYCMSVKEMDESKNADRKKRFTRFRDTLERANVNISIHIDRLITAHTVMGTLSDLLKSGRIDRKVGDFEMMAIAGVLEELDREISPDEAWLSKIRERRQHFDLILKLKEQMKELNKRARDDERAAAQVAFARHKLPPLTPFEKFRALRSAGQRDSFDR